MSKSPATVEAYLAALPADRREALESLRQVVLEHLPQGYEEGIQYGVIGYFVPHSIYPAGYHCDPRQPVPFASLASRKNYMALSLMCTYNNSEHEQWFREAWTRTGKKLDMGAACVRFKKLDDVPLDVVGEALARVPVKEFLEHYESVIKRPGGKRKGSQAMAKKAAKGTVKKKATVKKAVKKTRG